MQYPKKSFPFFSRSKKSLASFVDLKESLWTKFLDPKKSLPFPALLQVIEMSDQMRSKRHRTLEELAYANSHE